jgi:ureidoglycolate dehydrogenase (NAD+)
MPKRISTEELTTYCTEAMRKAGLSPDHARLVAEVLVATDTWGTFSHGTGALANYVNTIRSGGIDPQAKPTIAEQGQSWAVIDGHCAMGMLGSSMAMDLAIEKARQNTISWVGLRNSSHFGAAGYYANMAARHDMVGIAMSNTDPNMVVPGARGHVIGNNPIAYAVPAGKEDPIFLDIALSAVAAGKIFAMKALGKSIPENWLTDKDGLPICEVGDWPNSGSMMPMAGHKGYGIAILIEVLAGLLSGAEVLRDVKSWIFNPTEPSGLGQCFIAINIGSILPVQAFKASMDKMIQNLRQSPKSKGSNRVYVPGEIEWEKRADASKNGLALPESVIANLRKAGKMLEMDTSLFD